MKTINLQYAQSHFQQIAQEVKQGEEYVISDQGNPVMKLTPLSKKSTPITFGALKNQIKASDDFDAPLPDDLLDAFN